MSYSRYLNTATATDSGISPNSGNRTPAPIIKVLTTNTTTTVATMYTSHLTCWRSSPEARRSRSSSDPRQTASRSSWPSSSAPKTTSATPATGRWTGGVTRG
jgi:hypothetical protein